MNILIFIFNKFRRSYKKIFFFFLFLLIFFYLYSFFFMIFIKDNFFLIIIQITIITSNLYINKQIYKQTKKY